MSGARATSILATLCLALAFAVGQERSCDAFINVPGYDRCTIPPQSESLFFLVMAVLPSFFLPLREQVSTALIWIVYYLHVFGTIASAPYFSSNLYPYVSFAALVAVSFTGLSMLASRANISMPILPISRETFNKVYIGTITLFFLYISVRFPVSFNLVSIYDVYEVRKLFVESIGRSTSKIDTYMFLISGYAISPVSIIIGLHMFRKQKYLSAFSIIIGTIISIFVYSIAAYKSVIFIAIFVVLIYFVIREVNTVRGVILFLAAAALVCLLLGVTGLSETALIHWFRRAFLVPGMNVQYYLQEFGLDNASNMRDAPAIISRYVFGADGSANTGLFGNGIARGGLPGIALVLAVYFFILVLIDSVTRNVPLRVSVPILFPVGYIVANSATTSVFLTYGAVVSISVLYLLSSVRPERRATTP
ncbi:MAG: hypothetical protein M9924_08505 [Rhizobiaceae bacterium]|nr:hypothetical protein [Rhizobiaceae bacterium]